MEYLELLAPAKNIEIGTAAIDCGADAVYIAGEDFGARKAAGNSFEDIAALCKYAHRFGARIFVTYNTVICDGALADAHSQMLRSQEAGADAFIIRDPRICGWKDITLPLHASTQCAIRDAARAKYFEGLGCSRIILERQLSLATIGEICRSVKCEVECFVHGALCVCYSGDCRLSEYIDGRSADKGDCIQACRSLYDLVDGDGKVLLRRKAILSLKDFNLKSRLEDLAEAGVTSFKIEGRLKNASYVKNVVRDYDLALNALIAKYPDRYGRASFGRISGGFNPDTSKTFNRGYTDLYIDGLRGNWAVMDAPKSMGEAVGIVTAVRRQGGNTMTLSLRPLSAGLALRNGDGFAFITPDGVTGFRGDVCEGLTVKAKDIPELREGLTIYRNISSDFEKKLDSDICRREIPVSLSIRIHGKYTVDVRAQTQDGRTVTGKYETDVDTADNREREEAMIREQLSKKSDIYAFRLDTLEVDTAGGRLPLLSSATLNGIRRLTAEDINQLPCLTRRLTTGQESSTHLSTNEVGRGAELMRSKYCVRHELGMCPTLQGGRPPKQLFIVNNGRRFALGFDCRACEMTVTPAER